MTKEINKENEPIIPEELEEVEEEKIKRRRAVRFFESVGIFFLELIKVALLAGITIGLVRYFLFKPFYVKGQSMENTFYEHEYLIIDEISYRFREPERGEVIVFRSPTNPEDFYLKRVIGLPGERVKVEENKVVIYNVEYPQGMVLDEGYLDIGDQTVGSDNIVLGDNQFYVLGDNREASFDSRRFGPIDGSEIVGRTWFRGFPFNRIGVFNAPDYEL
ncbi:signal peptidase I [Patescibacteria group bacterium]|nr:signal peptidase I [Patescibacteria group bacterium]MBU1895974.1 signal peptidase I [Patescibacteria group bacterium]